MQIYVNNPPIFYTTSNLRTFMKYICPPHLTASFLSDGRIMVQDKTLGVAAKIPPFATAIFSLCTTPKSKEDIRSQLSSQGASLFDQLVSLGLLIAPEKASQEQMFDNFAEIAVHRRMLSDEVRLATYRKALLAVIHEESVVIDAGSGTGALAIYAALAGAKRVYAIENSSFAPYITEVAKANGVSDRVIVMNKNFAAVKLPEQADILVTETFGAWALAEGAAFELQQCARKNLRPDGLLLPHSIELWAAPMQEVPSELLHPFRNREDGLDLSFFQPYAQLRSSNIAIQHHDTAIHIATLSLFENSCEGQFTLQNDCEALALWFNLLFPQEIILSTHPQSPPTHWKQTIIAAKLPKGTHSFAGYPAKDDPRSYILRLNQQEFRIR